MDVAKDNEMHEVVELLKVNIPIYYIIFSIFPTLTPSNTIIWHTCNVVLATLVTSASFQCARSLMSTLVSFTLLEFNPYLREWTK